MEIIDETKNMFNSYFRLFKKQPTKNPESNMCILNLAMETLAYPTHLDNIHKQEILNNWEQLKHAWVSCTLEPSEDCFNLIEVSFTNVINLYRTNNDVINWYENEYKQNLLHTGNHIEENKYVWTIKNLQHHASAYTSFYESRYGHSIDL